MGRPYLDEIALFDQTLAWALSYDHPGLSVARNISDHRPIVVVASGGSITAAHFLGTLHTERTGQSATVLTPLEVRSGNLPRDCVVWFLSAGGGNTDILGAFDVARLAEPLQLVTLCGTPSSRLVEKAANTTRSIVIAFDLPSGKDGFLATNSLVAFCSLCAKIYNATSDDWQQVKGMALADLRSTCEGIWSKQTFIVLFSSATKAAAIDFESRFTEAALGNVQISDFRNFAHGRHHWLAKRGESTAVIAFATPDVATLARETLATLPVETPQVQFHFASSTAADSMRAILTSMHVAALAGEHLGYDPGRPGVPVFGQTLYELGGSFYDIKHPAAEIAIRRKARALGTSQSTCNWASGLKSFSQRLKTASIKALVLDYDGTIVETPDRFRPPAHDIAGMLKDLVFDGLHVGIATGRGKSVAEDLRSILPRALHDRVLLGFYNGSVLQLLSDGAVVRGPANTPADLRAFEVALKSDTTLSSLVETHLRPTQLTVETKMSLPEGVLWRLVSDLLARSKHSNLKIFRSSHSIDVVHRDVTKLSVINKICSIAACDPSNVLAIGDRGFWPGNDSELLSHPLSLSVDESSISVDNCWNLAPAGLLGSKATLYYFSQLVRAQDGWTLSPALYKDFL